MKCGGGAQKGHSFGKTGKWERPFSKGEGNGGPLPRAPTPAYPDLSVLVLTQPARSYSCAPCLPVPSLLMSSNAHTCPYLLMRAHNCSLPALAHTCPCLLTPALTCRPCPYLLVPVRICPCLSMPTSAQACLYLLSPVHVHTCPCLLAPALTCPHLSMPTPVKAPPFPCHSGSLPVFQPHWVYCSPYVRDSCAHFSPGFLPVPPPPSLL